ncbi:hypothetical protein ABMD26_003606 [Pseudomonas sp. PvP001]
MNARDVHDGSSVSYGLVIARSLIDGTRGRSKICAWMRVFGEVWG